MAEDLLKEATVAERPVALKRYRRALARFADLVVRDVAPADLRLTRSTAHSASAEPRGGPEDKT